MNINAVASGGFDIEISSGERGGGTVCGARDKTCLGLAFNEIVGTERTYLHKRFAEGSVNDKYLMGRWKVEGEGRKKGRREGRI